MILLIGVPCNFFTPILHRKKSMWWVSGEKFAQHKKDDFWERFQKPVFTYWEHIGIACTHFFSPKMQGFRNLSKGVTKTEKPTSQRSKVASYLYSMLQEEVLTLMAYFLASYDTTFWVKKFLWLNSFDPVSKVSAHSCRYLSLRAFIIHQNLQHLKGVWTSDERFDEFVNRKATHNDEEIRKSLYFFLLYSSKTQS